MQTHTTLQPLNASPADSSKRPWVISCTHVEIIGVWLAVAELAAAPDPETGWHVCVRLEARSTTSAAEALDRLAEKIRSAERMIELTGGAL